MSAPRSRASRHTLWVGGLVAIALAGCGATHSPETGSTSATTVGVNLGATTKSGAPIIVNDSPNTVAVAPPPTLHGTALAEFRQGEQVVEQAGCLGCHVIGADGNNGPGSPLTHVGARLSRVEITRTIVNPTAPMPSFAGLPKAKLRALTAFLADLR